MKTNKKLNSIKYINISIPFTILFLFLISSCKKDILDTAPKNKISDASAFSTSTQILAQVNGLYSLAKNASLYGGGQLVWSELHGDEWLNSSQNTGDGAAIFNQNVSASLSQINTLWAAGYSLINNSNILIANLNSSKVLLGSTQSASDSIKSIYIGEAKFLRAIAYFNLIQFYASPYTSGNGTQTGIPLRLTAVTSLTNGNVALSTVGQIYDRIILDLDSAELVLPKINQSASVNYFRAHKASAIALKTRVYLVQQNWANVIAEASKIVSATSPATGIGYGSVHKLETNITTVFNAVPYTGAEAILFFPFSSSDAGTGQAHPDYFFPSFVTLNPNYLVHTDSLTVFSAGSGDARNGFISRQGKPTAPIVYFSKFPTKSPLIDYIPAIRYAEVLLNYAEAAARTGDITNATSLLKAVRKRSNASFTFPAINITTQDSLVSTILHERRIELLGEGLRLFDLYRLGQAIPAKPGIPAVATTSSQYIWPIPSSEVSTNSFTNN